MSMEEKTGSSPVLPDRFGMTSVKITPKITPTSLIIQADVIPNRREAAVRNLLYNRPLFAHSRDVIPNLGISLTSFRSSVMLLPYALVL
jgi:hypothetical protein